MEEYHRTDRKLLFDRIFLWYSKGLCTTSKTIVTVHFRYIAVSFHKITKIRHIVIQSSICLNLVWVARTGVQEYFPRSTLLLLGVGGQPEGTASVHVELTYTCFDPVSEGDQKVKANYIHQCVKYHVTDANTIYKNPCIFKIANIDWVENALYSCVSVITLTLPRE